MNFHSFQKLGKLWQSVSYCVTYKWKKYKKYFDTSCTKNLNLFVNLVRVLPPCQVHPHVQTDLPLFLVVGVLQLCQGLVRMTTFPLAVSVLLWLRSVQTLLPCDICQLYLDQKLHVEGFSDIFLVLSLVLILTTDHPTVVDHHGVLLVRLEVSACELLQKVVSLLLQDELHDLLL